jgi:nucleoside-diphosphate-sugar epimerase
LVEGIVRLLRSSQTEPVNLGNPGEFSILEFARVILEVTGVKSRTVHRPLPVDDPQVRKPDISRAREVLGWNPKVELKEGIGRTIPYFQGRLTREK